jgi:multicomponent Na+:H+ antiporter subunit B
VISFPIIRIVTKLLIPYILLFGLYVQFHGDFGPGGGFQAGVIIASAIVLYSMVFGLPAAHKVAPPWVIEKLVAAGLLLYAGTGFASMFLPRPNQDVAVNGNFLEYAALRHNFLPGILPTDQHLGIFLVELGVGITVTAVMIIIFYAFAGRRRVA